VTNQVTAQSDLTVYAAALLELALDHQPDPSGSTGDPLIAWRSGWLHDLIGGTAYELLPAL
jgi:hypothetical protein